MGVRVDQSGKENAIGKLLCDRVGRPGDGGVGADGDEAALARDQDRPTCDRRGADRQYPASREPAGRHPTAVRCLEGLRPP